MEQHVTPNKYNVKIALLGDLIIDEYRYGTMARLNPESPAPLVSCSHVETRWGGAGNVCKNLESLGLAVDFFHANTPASVKTRVLADGVMICRLDQDVQVDNAEFLTYLESRDFSDYGLAVFSDYNKGTLRDCQPLIQRFRDAGIPVIVDPKQHCDYYKGAWAIKPNQKEFANWGYRDTAEDLYRFAEQHQFELVIVTRGRAGVIYYYQNAVHEIAALDVPVADITGAGDCFLAAFVYGIVQGHSPGRAIELAVRGSSESVRHPGTYVLSPKDLKRRVVFTNGCFDILHRGHIELLEQSRSLGDYLIVGLNSDRSVRKIKGSKRPINNQEDRKRALEALKCVDQVLIFDEDTPLNLIQQVRPDLITKGGDYDPEQVVGRELAPVQIIPYVQGYSTTKLLGINND